MKASCRCLPVGGLLPLPFFVLRVSQPSSLEIIGAACLCLRGRVGVMATWRCCGWSARLWRLRPLRLLVRLVVEERLRFLLSLVLVLFLRLSWVLEEDALRQILPFLEGA